MKELRGRKAMKAVTGKASEGARHEDELDARQDTCLASNSSSCRASSFAGRCLRRCYPVLEALLSLPDDPEAYYELPPRRRPCRR